MRILRLNVFLVLTLTALTMVAAPKRSILSLKESITDSAIVYPYSFETNTHELMKNWYLQNYAVLDNDVENKATGDVSDSEYIRRLKAIPSGVELPYNQVVRSYIERYTQRNRTLVSQMLGMSPYYMPIFEQALEKEGMPLELKYIPVIESALDPNAVSPVGASGLWQFMLETAKGVGLEVNSLVDERRDPYRSSDRAVYYFKQLYGIYGDWSLAIAAYNCGPGNVNKALRRAKGNSSHNPDFWEIYDYLPRETRGYVPAFIAATYVMNYYQEHNISPSLAKKPLLIDTVKVNQRIHFNQIAQVLNIPIEEIRILNPQYRHDVIPGDTHPYTLALPSQQIYSFIMVEDSITKYRPELYATRDVREPGTANEAPTSFLSTYDDVRAASTAPSSGEQKATSATESAGLHKVKKGESLRSIADDYGMSVEQLMELNGLSRKRVHRGQVLRVAAQGRQVAQNASSSQSRGEFKAVAAVEASKAQDRPVNEKNIDRPVVSRPAVQASTGTTAYKGSYSINDEISTSSSNRRNRDAESRSKATPKEPVADKKAKRATNESEKTTPSSRKKAKQEDTEKADKSKKSRNSSRADKATEKKKNEEPQSTSRRKRASKRNENTTVTAKRGEILEDIAKKNGVSVDDLREANPGIRRRVKAGTEITIPKVKEKKTEKTSSRRKRSKSRAEREEAAKPVTHDVKSGESLERIARRNGVSVDDLRKANPKLKGDMIKPGDNLKIPSKKKSSTGKKKRRK